GHAHGGGRLIELVERFLQGFHHAIPFGLAAGGFFAAAAFFGFTLAVEASATSVLAGTAAGSTCGFFGGSFAGSTALAKAGCTTAPPSVSIVALTSSSSRLTASVFDALSIMVSRKV